MAEPMHTINLRVPPDLYKWLEAEGRALDLAVSTAARALLVKARAIGVTLK